MRVKKNTPQEIVVAFKTRQREDNDANDKDEVDITFPVGGTIEDIAPLFSGPIWSAIIWQRSVEVMCNYMIKNPSEFENRKVVELGCGLGLPGLLSGITCGASEVVLTDREEDLAVASRAIKKAENVLNSFSKVSAVSFNWEHAPPHSFDADVILAVECVSADVYGADSLHWLVNAITNVAKKHSPVVLYLCSVRRKDDGLDQVLRLLEASIEENEPPMLLPVDGNDAELYRMNLRISPL